VERPLRQEREYMLVFDSTHALCIPKRHDFV
jgi:hypothetical protein